MKKIVLFLVCCTFIANAQTARGVRIGYIDMEYILEKVPDYAEANNQLEQKAQKWKQEIEVKKNEIKVLKDNLKVERVLLTKELIEERQEEIDFLENELLDYQEKRFGPKGDLILQKTVLVKPIQDQIFTIVQDVAEQRNYDFIFDKSSDLTMLFAAQRYDISDYVVRKLTSSQKREEMSKKQLKAFEAKEELDELIADNPAVEERQKKLDERKAARDSLIAVRQKAIDDRKAEAAAKRKKLQEERDAKKNGTVIEKTSAEGSKEAVEEKDSLTSPSADDKKTAAEQARQKLIDDRNKKLEERKKALDDKKKKAAADREAAIKAKEQKTEKKE